MTVIALPVATRPAEAARVFTLNLPDGMVLLNRHRLGVPERQARLARAIANATRQAALLGGVPRLDSVQIAGIYRPSASAARTAVAENWRPTLDAAVTGLRRAGVIVAGHTRVDETVCEIGDLAPRALYQVVIRETDDPIIHTTPIRGTP
jgi:hypothetical protein